MLEGFALQTSQRGLCPCTPLGEPLFWRKKGFPQAPSRNSLTFSCGKIFSLLSKFADFSCGKIFSPFSKFADFFLRKDIQPPPEICCLDFIKHLSFEGMSGGTLRDTFNLMVQKTGYFAVFKQGGVMTASPCFFGITALSSQSDRMCRTTPAGSRFPMSENRWIRPFSERGAQVPR